jgi:hypothetical protein
MRWAQKAALPPHRRPSVEVGSGAIVARWLADARTSSWLIRQGENAARRI